MNMSMCFSVKHLDIYGVVGVFLVTCSTSVQLHVFNSSSSHWRTLSCSIHMLLIRISSATTLKALLCTCKHNVYTCTCNSAVYFVYLDDIHVKQESTCTLYVIFTHVLYVLYMYM